MSSNGRRRGASLYDFRDLDLMHHLSDDEADTEALAELMGLPSRSGLGTRLGWMRRYGILERDEDTGVWRLSPGGRRVTEARLRAATMHELEGLPEAAMIEAMAAVTARYRLAEPMTATMLRREFLFGTRR